MSHRISQILKWLKYPSRTSKFHSKVRNFWAAKFEKKKKTKFKKKGIFHASRSTQFQVVQINNHRELEPREA